MTNKSETPIDPEKPGKTESPVRHFEQPQDVVNDDDLTDKSKKKALDNWEVDAQALQRAEDEGMGGGEKSKLIDVVDAKESIGAPTKSPVGAATKTPGRK